uniref:Uncharacterized protein n=1 Tax=Sphaerodactylus townsendi TaxID=933632 RepID=A0ACB8ELN8_9SAUR
MKWKARNWGRGQNDLAPQQLAILSALAGCSPRRGTSRDDDLALPPEPDPSRWYAQHEALEAVKRDWQSEHDALMEERRQQRKEFEEELAREKESLRQQFQCDRENQERERNNPDMTSNAKGKV